MTDGIPEPPDYLSEAAKRVWRAFAPHYRITIADIPVYEHFCDSYARYQELTQKANEVGPLVIVKGTPCTNPNLARADKEAANFKHALGMLLRTHHGRTHDADDFPEETPATDSEAENLEGFRAKLLDLLTDAGEDDRGSPADRPTGRHRTSKGRPETAARPVRQKKET